MGICLVTTLKEATWDTSLLKLGEMVINIKSTLGVKGYFNGSPNKTATLRIEGNGYFTDETYTSNLGKNITCNTGLNSVYSSAGNYKIVIENKSAFYAVSFLHSTRPKDVSYELGDLLGLGVNAQGKNQILAQNQDVSGNLLSISGWGTSLSVLQVQNTDVTGKLSDLANLTGLTELTVDNTKITGDTSDLANLTNLTTFTYANTAITGNWPLT